MHTYKEIVEKLSDTATKEDMEKLTDLTSDFLESIKEKVPEVEKLLTKIDLMLNPKFTRDTAEYAVSKMKNEDGTEGGHWDYDTTTKVMRDKGYDFNPCDWYYVLNMVYSDSNYRIYLKDYPESSPDWYERNPLTYDEWLQSL